MPLPATTYTGTISDLTGVPVTSGQVIFKLMPSIDKTLSGTSRFVLMQLIGTAEARAFLRGGVRVGRLKCHPARF